MSVIHYYANYVNSRDIDCFFKIRGVAYHFASNGQPIPQFITRKTNIEIQDFVYSRLSQVADKIRTHKKTIKELIQKEICDQDKNDNTFDEKITNKMINEYAESFQEMAKLGFISMDLDEKGVFHVIAEPVDKKIETKELLDRLPAVNDKDVRIL